MTTTSRVMASLVASLIALALGACGASDPGSTTGSGSSSVPPTSAESGGSKGGSNGGSASVGVPKALAANREQANQLLDDGSLQAKLDELRGHPIVINQWASWCPPCKAEFPYFQASSEAHVKDVAFVGIDMQDDRGAAEAFLAGQPVPYPSVSDPSASQISSLGGGIVSPTTVFIDESGKVVSVFQGAYTSRDQLEADIDKYLLG